MDSVTDFVTDFLSCISYEKKHKKKTGFASDLSESSEIASAVTEKGRKPSGVKIHSKIHDQNPHRTPGETCCLWNPSPPPPKSQNTPTQNKEVHGHGGFLQKIPGAHQIDASISGPGIAGRKITDNRLSLILEFR